MYVNHLILPKRLVLFSRSGTGCLSIGLTIGIGYTLTRTLLRGKAERESDYV
jgi:hypothetical protein